MLRLNLYVLAASTLLLVALTARPQSQVPPTFDVATIRPSQANGVPAFQFSQGRFRSSQYPLLIVLGLAYGVSALEIDAPRWVRDAKFDIEAIYPSTSSRTEGLLMLRELLKERFEMVVRWETRTVDVLALVVAHKDGALGPNLRRVSVDCAALTGTPNRCRTVEGPAEFSSVGRLWNEIDLTRIVMASVGSLVVDRTGLTGQFDLTLHWAQRLPASTTTGAGPVMESALQEQLGLKLEKQKEATEMLVIQKISRTPTPN